MIEKIKNLIYKNRLLIINFIIIFSLLFISFIAFYPAIMTSDSQDQWNQILTGSFKNTHPAFYTWLVSLLTIFWKSPAVLSVFQIFIFSFIWTYGIKTVVGIKDKYNLFEWIFPTIMTFIVGLFPLNGIFAVTFWKDILYSYILLLYLIWIYKIFIQNINVAKKQWIILIILSIIISTFRHNGIIVALLLLIMIGLKIYFNDKKSRKEIIKYFLIFFAIYAFISVIFVPHLLKAEKSNPIFSRAPMIHMTGKLLSTDSITDENDLAFLNNIISIDDWKNLYNNYSHNTLMFSGKINRKYLINNSSQFIKITIKSVLHNPKPIVSHYIELTSIVWSINERSDAHTNAIVNQIYESDLSKKLGLETKPISKKINKKYNEILKNISLTPVLKTICCRPALYMYLSFIIVALLCFISKSKKFLSLLSPMIFNICSILPILTDQDTRYFYITFLTFFFIILMFGIYCYNNKKALRKTHNDCLKNGTYKLLIFTIILLLFDYYTYFNMRQSLGDIGIKKSLIFILFYLLSNGCCYIVYYYLKKNKNCSIEKKFFIIGLLIGISYLIFIPIMSGTDEHMHFYRAYQISEGDIFTDKNTATPINENLLALPYRGFNDNYNKNIIFQQYDDHLNNTVPNTIAAVGYSPTTYIPQVIGFMISKLFHVNAFFTVLIVRFINFIAWLLIVYEAIKIMPYKKTFFALFCLSPAILSLAASSSGDIFPTAIGFLYISLIFKLYKEKRQITRKEKILFLIMSIILALFKTIYSILLLLLLIIPKECFENNQRKRIQYISMIILTALIISFAWLRFGNTGGIKNPNYSLQFNFVLNHPFQYIMTCFRTYYDKFYDYLFNFVAGGEMCFGKANISSLWAILYIILLVVSYFHDRDEVKLPICLKLLIWAMFILILVAVSSAMYLDWTPRFTGIGGKYIIGVQSRYFVLFVPLIILTLPKSKTLIKDKIKIFNACVIINSVVLMECVTSVIIYRIFQ